MSSEVDICNIALARVGQTLITALSENDKKARLCNVLYPNLRDFVLQEMWWTFATERQTLSQLTETPDSEFDYYYQLPSDCLQPRYLVDNSIEYRVETDRIATDSTDDIELVYTKKETDSAKFSPLFIDALAYRLASELVIPLINDSTKHSNFISLYVNVISKARKIDQQRGYKKVPTQTSWVSSRTGGVNNIAKKLTSEI